MKRREQAALAFSEAMVALGAGPPRRERMLVPLPSTGLPISKVSGAQGWTPLIYEAKTLGELVSIMREGHRVKWRRDKAYPFSIKIDFRKPGMLRHRDLRDYQPGECVRVFVGHGLLWAEGTVTKVIERQPLDSEGVETRLEVMVPRVSVATRSDIWGPLFVPIESPALVRLVKS